MRSKLLILTMLVLSIALAGQAFGAATATITPNTVPKGAYVNGPGGPADDNFYWQALKITFGGAHTFETAAITITLPTGMYIADTDEAGSVDNDVSLSWVTTGTTTFAVNAATAAGSIVLNIGAANTQNNDYVWVMFPIITDLNPGVTPLGYAIHFTDNTPDADIPATSCPITYRDAGALDVAPFTTKLSGDNDSTSTYGLKYPDTAAPLWTTLPDLVADLTDRAVGASGVISMNGTDTDDVTYTLWAATDSTLSQVNDLTTGVTPAIKSTGGNFTVKEGATGDVSSIATAALPEGNYYFYITSSLTGDFPLVRSGKLHIRHYPELNVLGWDYDGGGVFDISGGDADDEDVTLDTGLYLGYGGTLGTTAREDLVVYFKVDDYDDDARVNLYYSTNSGLTSSSITTSGTSPNLVVTGLTGAIPLDDIFYENRKDGDGFLRWTWDVTPAGTTYIPANEYTLYVVANDGKHQSILASKGSDDSDQETVTIKHSPNLAIDALNEYDSNLSTADEIDILTASNDVIMLSWGKAGVSGDSDIDDSAVISFYIAADGNDEFSVYASTDAATLLADVDNPIGGVHQIVTGLQENPESKSSSYYAWDLKADNKATGWSPTDGDIYHLYAIIDENRTGGIARVVALGGDIPLTAPYDLTTGVIGNLIFTNDTWARAYDPPADGVTVDGDQTYRIRFDAFNFEADADIGIYVVKTSTATAGGTTPGDPTAVIGNFNAWDAGGAGGEVYCLTSVAGDDAAPAWLSENTDTFFDMSISLPSAGVKYTTDIGGGAAPDISDDSYWVYVGGVGGTFYRAPGILTLKNTATTPLQKNLMLTPSVFTVAKGDTMTFSVSAGDLAPQTVNLIDAYIAVEKAYFDVVSSSAPFTEGAATGTLIANEVIDDMTNNRWILHATVFSSGTVLTPFAVDLGDVEATFRLVSKGTTNALGASSSLYFVNEPANRWVTRFMNDGSNVSINIQQNEAFIQPRGIIEGIVEFEGRANSNYTATFELRKRGSYEVTSDAAFIAANDADTNTSGIQLALDNDGKFTLSKVPSGTWDFVVTYPRYLSKKQPIDIDAGLDDLFVDFGKLLGGDCVGYTDSSGAAWPNNRISSNDIDRISEAFLATPSNPKWNNGVQNWKWADIDESGKVGIEDLQMATANYNGVDSTKAAQPVWAKPAGQPAVSNSNALVEFVNLPSELKAGQSYTMQVVIRNASAVRGYYVDVNYDRNALSFEKIATGGFISASTQSFPVIGEGSVGLANATYGNAVFSGDGVLAEITFTAKTDGMFTPDMLGVKEITVVNAGMLAETIAVEDPTIVSNVPKSFALGQNFPNPFNPTTTISFNMPQSGYMTMKVYDVLGRCVRTLASGEYAAGNYSIVWDATDDNGNNISAGLYFYTISAKNYHATRRMMFIK